MPLPVGPFYGVVGTPATPQFIRTVMLGHTPESNGTTRPVVNIFDFRCPLPAPGGAEAAFTANFQGIVQATYLACMTADYILDAILSRYMDDPTNAGTLTNVAAGGGIGADRGPSFQAVVVRKKTGLAGRNFRGSIHHGAVPETFTTQDQLNGGTGLPAYNALLGQYTALLGGVGDGVNQFFPIVLSPTLSVLTANPRVFAGAPVTSFTLNTRLGTMKRRKERG